MKVNLELGNKPMMLQLKNITHSFSANKKILDNVSLELEKGKIYALMGANGSGKSTLFNILSGFIKPHSGDIIFNSRKINGLPPYKINHLGLGRTFQDLRLITKLTVKENIVLAMNNNPTQEWYRALLPKTLYKTELNYLNERAEEIITECYLFNIKHNFAGEISYGEQKLLNLACCIANDAKLLILDEPIAGINLHYQKQILKLLKKLIIKQKSIFLIEHNIEFLEQITKQFFFLKNGHLKAYDSFTLLKKDKEVVDAYLKA